MKTLLWGFVWAQQEVLLTAILQRAVRAVLILDGPPGEFYRFFSHVDHVLRVDLALSRCSLSAAR
jgi:hypothetical protein